MPQSPAESRLAAMQRRASDWRIGPVVYQVFVDRFAPSERIDEKRALYGSPRKLRTWSENPTGGTFLPEVGVWSHEMDFWGGDIASLRMRMDHVRSLGDVLYLNPIHEAMTNHKYDATNWDKIAPEYGSYSDFEGLARDVHSRKMRLVLDGVFNHCGKNNPIFQEALTNPKSVRRDWFLFGKEHPGGYRAWAQVPNLPEVNLENEATRQFLWKSDASIVAKFLKDGADGWRLDVAHELGLEYLAELTASAHKHKNDSLVIGEVWNYPSRWTDSMDGLLSIFMGRLILDYANGNFSSRQIASAMSGVVADSGIEPTLRSWVVLGNHDTERLATVLPDAGRRHFAQALQFTLPGAPLVYYGDEVGMQGGGDPAQRRPMRWDLVKPENADLAWTKKLVSLRRGSRALRIGDFRALAGEKLFGFLRTTEKALEGVIVVANPTNERVSESFVVPDPTLMGYTLLKDAISGEKLRVAAGTVRVTVAPMSVMVLTIDEEAIGRGQYKRMKDG